MEKKYIKKYLVEVEADYPEGLWTVEDLKELLIEVCQDTMVIKVKQRR